MKAAIGWVNGVVILLIVITGAHLAYNWSRAANAPLSGVSDFEVGSRIPILTLVPVNQAAASGSLADPEACTIVVFFSPECTHCHTAARRDATLDSSNALPVSWVAGKSVTELVDFASILAPNVRLFSSPDAHDLLHVRAVPAGFLVSPTGIVTLVFPYQGQDVVPRSRWDAYCRKGSA